ncbi:mannosylglycerate hydrolase [Gemmiger formicilis]|uniref:mannosylglycerate hydrolase n=1 Tax=Gemmiger formicilis TaxID=745368 RepID=UPI00195CFAC1|nr:mannosylglycerate hydrolase [Gemmiger formicilis]MBM6715347.1 mannosylglycerate hydrolase [Gemmiger formicilis]
MASQIHVVPHFHWDREWYFTAEESKILLVNDMEEVLTRLEQDPDYPCFVLDGQTAVLEDYLSVCPENRARIEALVRAGKLIIGPWYTQTDEMVVGGESILRNLLYGKLDCEPFGDRMMIGYLPDSFGQTARLPQILNGFGITRCMFWRGTSERMGSDKTEFIWEGDDHARLTVQLLPLGYAIGKYLPTEPQALRDRMDKYLPVLDRGATTDHILLPNGHDQMPLQKNITEVMKQIEACYPGRTTRLGRYEEVFEEVEKNPSLDTLRGEFLDGKYMRVHRSIYSTRADLKSANTRIENKITNILEPLASIAYSLGFEYHHGLIEAIWKEILKNHAHDSMGCCCSDKVHRAIADRFFLAEERTDRLIDFYKRKIVDAMDMEHGLDKFTAFNTLPYPRSGVVTGSVITRMKQFALRDEDGREHPYEIRHSEVVDAGLIDRQIVHYGNYAPFVRYDIAMEADLPSMGYRTWFVQPCEAPVLLEPAAPADCLENEYYHITIVPNGTLTVTDKTDGTVYDNVLLVEDGSDDGDEYDYSPLPEDWVLTSVDAAAQHTVTRHALLDEAAIALHLPVPANLDSRRAKVCDGAVDFTIHVVLRAHSRNIELHITADNQADDHRVRLLIPNRLAARCSVSDNQFGSITRAARDDAMDVWEAEHWSERPDAIYPFLSYVAQDSGKGLCVLTNSVREYELVGEEYSTIAVTLFRCVGLLGKEELYRRPGRPSGIRMKTPASQMHGVQTYELALTADRAHVQQMAKEYTTPVVTYNKMPYNAMKLNTPTQSTPYTYSLLALDNDQLTMSTMKKEEQGNHLLLRCYNSTAAEQSAALTGGWALAGEAQLDETPLPGPLPEGRISLVPNQTRTLRLTRPQTACSDL